MAKAIFLDRDGVINFERGEYTFQLDKFIINEGVIEALVKFKKKGYLLFVITNQGGISKGIYKHEMVDEIHDFLNRKLQESGVDISAIYYCPHHPDQGNCICRKPNYLLIEKVIARYNINNSLLS